MTSGWMVATLLNTKSARFLDLIGFHHSHLYQYKLLLLGRTKTNISSLLFLWSMNYCWSTYMGNIHTHPFSCLSRFIRIRIVMNSCPFLALTNCALQLSFICSLLTSLPALNFLFAPKVFLLVVKSSVYFDNILQRSN